MWEVYHFEYVGAMIILFNDLMRVFRLVISFYVVMVNTRYERNLFLVTDIYSSATLFYSPFHAERSIEKARSVTPSLQASSMPCTLPVFHTTVLFLNQMIGRTSFPSQHRLTLFPRFLP